MTETGKGQRRDAYKYELRALWTTFPNFELSNASHALWNRMNLTGGPHSPATRCRRKPKRASISALSSRRRPVTPHSKWKFFDEDDGKLAGGGQFRRARVAVSARKLAAGLWQLRFTEVSAGGGGIGGFKCGPCDRVGSQLVSSLPHPKFSVEESTKWEPRCSKVSHDDCRFYGRMGLLQDQKGASITIVSALQAELFHAQSRICELEAEERSSKEKVKRLLRKVEEERVSWRSREQKKIHAVVDDLKDELDRERKSCQMIYMLNTKLVIELANAKLSAKQIMQNYQEEKRGRDLMEEVCNELAKQIGEDKAEVEALKRESMKFHEEVEEERRMLQMAEVWREERVQMKLVDAKLALEDRYCKMNKLLTDLETFLQSRSSTLDVMDLRKAELILQAVKSMDVQDIKEFSYMPPKSNDIFSMYEDLRKFEAKGDEIEPCVNYSPTRHASKIQASCPNNGGSYKTSMLKHPNHAIEYKSGLEEEEETRGWGRGGRAEDQSSSYSVEGSTEASVGRVFSQGKNVLESGTECDENADHGSLNTEVSEVCLLVEGNGNGRAFPSGGGIRCQDTAAQRGAPESANPHITRGMKGGIEWRRGIQKPSSKPKLLGVTRVRMESQKSQLRHILKQKT